MMSRNCRSRPAMPLAPDAPMLQQESPGIQAKWILLPPLHPRLPPSRRDGRRPSSRDPGDAATLLCGVSSFCSGSTPGVRAPGIPIATFPRVTAFSSFHVCNRQPHPRLLANHCRIREHCARLVVAVVRRGPVTVRVCSRASSTRPARCPSSGTFGAVTSTPCSPSVLGRQVVLVTKSTGMFACAAPGTDRTPRP